MTIPWLLKPSLQQEPEILGLFISQLSKHKNVQAPLNSQVLQQGLQSSALTKHGEEPTGKPDEQGEAHAAGVFQDSFGGDEDAAANHAADEQRESPQQSDLLPQEDGLFFLVFPHGFLLITGEGHTFRSYSLPSVLKVHL